MIRRLTWSKSGSERVCPPALHLHHRRERRHHDVLELVRRVDVRPVEVEQVDPRVPDLELEVVAALARERRKLLPRKGQHALREEVGRQRQLVGERDRVEHHLGHCGRFGIILLGLHEQGEEVHVLLTHAPQAELLPPVAPQDLPPLLLARERGFPFEAERIVAGLQSADRPDVAVLREQPGRVGQVGQTRALAVRGIEPEAADSQDAAASGRGQTGRSVRSFHVPAGRVPELEPGVRPGLLRPMLGGRARHGTVPDGSGAAFARGTAPASA